MSEEFRVLVTGWRDWPWSARRIVHGVLESWWWHFVPYANRYPGGFVVVHGKCPKGGVDLWAHQWAENWDDGRTKPEPHPADFAQFGKAAGPIRNAEMVALGARVCLAFPGPGSKGTWDCLEKAVNVDMEIATTGWLSRYLDTSSPQ